MSTKEQIEKIEKIALEVWQKYKPYQIQERLQSIWDAVAIEAGVDKGFEPIYPLNDEDDKITCGILGSGGFSTGQEELIKAFTLKKKLGWSPVEYNAVISNRERSNATSVASEFDLPSLVLDYTQWRKENGISGSTKLFGFEPGEEPPLDVLERRIDAKKAFDKGLHDAIVEKLGEIPRSISLRGYDFILTDELFSCDTEVDNTHPATLIIREPNGEPAYAGWQESAYNKMRSDGLSVFPTTLIRVGYIGVCNDLMEVDAGEMLAISPGCIGDYHKIEDHYLLTLKATGLLPYFWGISKEPMKVEYETIDGKSVYIQQHLIIVGDKIKSGNGVFGQDADDLNIFKKVL